MHVTQHDLVFNRWGMREAASDESGTRVQLRRGAGNRQDHLRGSYCSRAGRAFADRPLRACRVDGWARRLRTSRPRSAWRARRTPSCSSTRPTRSRHADRRRSIEAFVRESNTVISVLLQELEGFNGVVIFATNLAANFDPAFERRIRTHILFEMPGVNEREQIWRVQLHPSRTPLADDVDFRALAERYEVSGGDIRNAVLKAALAAAGEPGSDTLKRIHQRHFEDGMREVLAGKKVMKQSLLDVPAPIVPALEAALPFYRTPRPFCRPPLCRRSSSAGSPLPHRSSPWCMRWRRDSRILVLFLSPPEV